MKPIIYRRCSVCGWWQVRAETETTFMYTPCHCFALPDYMPKQMNKADVEIVNN